MQKHLNEISNFIIRSIQTQYFIILWFLSIEMTMQERNIISLKINKHMVTMHKKQESLVYLNALLKNVIHTNMMLKNTGFHRMKIFTLEISLITRLTIFRIF